MNIFRLLVISLFLAPISAYAFDLNDLTKGLTGELDKTLNQLNSVNKEVKSTPNEETKIIQTSSFDQYFGKQYDVELSTSNGNILRLSMTFRSESGVIKGNFRRKQSSDNGLIYQGVLNGTDLTTYWQIGAVQGQYIFRFNNDFTNFSGSWNAHNAAPQKMVGTLTDTSYHAQTSDQDETNVVSAESSLVSKALQRKRKALEKENLLERKSFYDTMSGGLQITMLDLEKFHMNFGKEILSDFEKICRETGECEILYAGNFPNNKMGRKYEEYTQIYLNHMQTNSLRFERSNDNLRLALDILNYLYSGDKTKRKIIALSPNGCIFGRPSTIFGLGLTIYALDNVIPNTAGITFNNKYEFQGDTPVEISMSLIVSTWQADYRTSSEFWRRINMSPKKSGSISLSTNIDLQRAAKAQSLLFEKVCTGAKASEF